MKPHAPTIAVDGPVPPLAPPVAEASDDASPGSSGEAPGGRVQPVLHRVSSRTVVDEVHHQLRAMILVGALPPETRLIELDVAAQMGTSQASVREAIHRLERDGFVERRPRLGSFVTPVLLDDVHEILEVRIAIERIAAQRAALRGGAERGDQLREIVERMRDAGRARDMVALTEHDLAFHRQICLWSDHRTLLRAWVPLSTQVQRLMVIAQPFRYPDLTVLADTHLPIIDMIEHGDATAAADAVGDHIEGMWRDFTRLRPEMARSVYPGEG